MSTNPKKEQMKKITVSLPEEIIDTLKRLANDQGITATAALRQAIKTEEFLRNEIQEKHSKILIQDEKGKTQQIVFR